MSNASRKTSREALKALLNTALVGTGLPGSIVYDHPAAAFTKTPATIIQSRGTSRAQYTTESDKSWVHLDVVNFVLYADKATSYTNDTAEDTLDSMESIIAGVIQSRTNQKPTGGAWIALQFDGDSECDYQVIGGKMYRTEIIPVKTKVVDLSQT